MNDNNQMFEKLGKTNWISNKWMNKTTQILIKYTITSEILRWE